MDWLTALLGVGGSLLGGILGQQGAQQAAQQQAELIKRAIDVQQGGIKTGTDYIKGATTQSVDAQNKALTGARTDLMPWMTAGRDALTQYQGELGMGGPGFVSKFRETPGYQFAVDEGEKGAVNNLRALGMGGSGAALKALTRFRTGLADQTYNTYLDRVKGVADNGQSAATHLGDAGIQTAANIGGIRMGGANSIAGLTTGGAQNIAQNLISLGGAQASGTVGGTNSWLNALGNGLNNIGKSLGSGGWNFLPKAA